MQMTRLYFGFNIDGMISISGASSTTESWRLTTFYEAVVAIQTARSQTVSLAREHARTT